ncbi:acyl carrier protein [Sphingobium sp. SCG-1]|uniref:acyl carrier protein n=1 Tax=Sphingobium sp. SCG-1 TaxID=2072936 RepID=UPI000CD69880|nr:acyl carrier protein [Sphingobium sp. SCG-1]AUW58805.1 acyl carrier protein [Sphingobium sp. SCG-1]
MSMHERVRVLMADVLEVPIESLSADVDRESLPEWDSLAHLRLMTALEEEFGVRPTMSDIGNVYSFDDVVMLAQRR